MSRKMISNLIMMMILMIFEFNLTTLLVLAPSEILYLNPIIYFLNLHIIFDYSKFILF